MNMNTITDVNMTELAELLICIRCPQVGKKERKIQIQISHKIKRDTGVMNSPTEGLEVKTEKKKREKQIEHMTKI